jgi:hypothetical protein
MITLKDLLTDPQHITDKNTIHTYIDNFYDLAFEPYKDKDINFVEIGVHDGGSMTLWKEYFTNAEIYGMDNRLHEPCKEFADKHGINYIIGNAYDDCIVNQIPNIDIFIDDGPHTLESQLISIEKYLPKMNSNGIFIIEDIQSYDYLNILKQKAQNIFPSYRYEIIDLRQYKNRYDDLLFVAYT